MSLQRPSEITTAGKLGANMWLAGCVVRIRERAPKENGKAGGASQSGTAKGVGGKGKKKSTGARAGLEIHINAGTTPADVMLVEAWDPPTVQLMRNVTVLGEPSDKS